MTSSERKKLAAKLTAETLNRHQKHWREWLSTKPDYKMRAPPKKKAAVPMKTTSPPPSTQDQQVKQEETPAANQFGGFSLAFRPAKEKIMKQEEAEEEKSA